MIITGRCTCNSFRCPRDRINSGSCYSTSLPGGWGVRCCKPYCACKHSCESDETDEGMNGTVSDDNNMTSQHWQQVGKDLNNNCPDNKTFCCPKCKCEMGVCKVREVRARQRHCGDNVSYKNEESIC